MSKHERTESEEEMDGPIKRVKTKVVINDDEKDIHIQNIQTSPVSAPYVELGAPQPAEVREEALAVTVLGHSFKHGIDERKKHATIFAKSYRELSYIKQVKRNPNINPQLWKEALNWTAPYPSTKEADEQYLVVGLVLHDPTSSSRWVTPPENVDPLTSEPPARNTSSPEPTIQNTANLSVYLAVTTIVPLQGINNDFFALMPSKSGRGRPHIVREDDIFFFSEYRSNLQTAKTRRRHWKAAVVHAWKTVVEEGDSAAGPGFKVNVAANRETGEAEGIAEPEAKVDIKARGGLDNAVSQGSNFTEADGREGVVSKVRAWLGMS